MRLFGVDRTPSAKRRYAARVVAESVVQTQLETGVEIFWRVAPDDLEQVDAPLGGTVVLFSKSDFRFVVPKPMSAERAKSYAVRQSESEERMRVVNLSRRNSRIYAAPVSRLNDSKYRIAPGMQALDAMLEARGLTAPVVVGFVANSRDGSQRLVVLQALNASGTTDVSVSVNPEDVDQSVALFVNAMRLPEDCPRVLFSAAEFVSAARGLTVFPSEPEWHGISTRTIALLSIAMAMSAAIGTAGVVAYQYFKERAAHAEATEIQNQSLATETRIGKLIADSPVAIAQHMSLPTEQTFARAESMWIEGGRVAFRADRGTVEYKLTVPLVSAGSTRSGHATHAESNLQQVNSALKLHPPVGCTRRENATTGLANEVQVAVHCQNISAPLSL